MCKKSFLLYLDSYDHIADLPREQRGDLLLLLFDYARRVAEEGNTDIPSLLRQYPDLAPETCMAFRFLSESIRRDTEKWREKHRRYSEAALRRTEEGKVSFARKREESTRPERDNSWMREYILRD